MSVASNFFSQNQDRDNIERINGNDFIFNVMLFNGITEVKLKFAAMDELVIIDDLKYFYCYGKLTFSYNNEAIEAFESLGDTEPGSTTKQFEPYVFRGDGRDLLIVDIMPKLHDNECLEISSTESEKEDYCIRHVFSIYEYEDLNSSTGFKRRTLYFWDRDFQLMRNLSLNFSTDEILQGNTFGEQTVKLNSSDVDVSGSTVNNSVLTGEAIKGILTFALQREYQIPVKFGEWDEGAAYINYTSPSQNKASDDLDDILMFHVSTDENYNLPAILKKKRYTEEYELIPLNNFYDDVLSRGSSILGSLLGGSKLTEDFFIGKLDPGGGGCFGGGDFGGTNKANITDYNLIDNYSFRKISSEELQQYFTTYAVHTNDPRGFFKTDMKNNNYQSIKDMYDKVFLKNMPSRKGVFSNSPDNIIREVHKNPQHVYLPHSLQEKQRKSLGINKSMLNLFFKNTSINFNVRGNTMRKTGLFFTVNRRDSAKMPTYDSNVLGTYMITYLRHEFKGGTYTNHIHGTKPYADEDPNFARVL